MKVESACLTQRPDEWMCPPLLYPVSWMPSSLAFSHSPLILKRPNNSSADFGVENKSGGLAEGSAT